MRFFYKLQSVCGKGYTLAAFAFSAASVFFTGTFFLFKVTNRLRYWNFRKLPGGWKSGGVARPPPRAVSGAGMGGLDIPITPPDYRAVMAV
jgi:hypothetical protein